jgi:hypothetical protein
VWCPALLIVAYLNHPAGTSHAAARRFILPPATLFATTAVALTTFRIVYFGYPLPNTYYAKVSPSLVYRLQQGTGYLASYIGSSPIVFACTVAAAISAAHLLRARARDGRTFALTVLAATGLGVPVLTGGDHFDGFRFYQPIYPLLLLTLLNAVRTIAPQYIPAAIHARVNRRVTLTAAAIALGVCVVLQTVQWLATDRFALLGREFDIATAGRTVGTNANLVFGPDRPSIATITVGGFQYAYHGDVVDLMGLNDTRMAHNGGDRIGIRSHAAFETRTFYELNPAVLLPLVQFHDSLSAVGHRDLFADRVLKGLLAEPQFRSRYQLAEVCRPGAEGAKFVGWFERTLLDRLSTTSGLQVVVADRDYR